MAEKHKQIVIAGYYGYGNTGDEAILSAILESFLPEKTPPKICVLSGNPEETKNFHRTDSVHWGNIKEIIDCITNCDAIIIGGGGIFHDYWGVNSSTILTSKHIGLGFYMSIAMIAELLNKPIILYSVGVGPLLTRTGKDIARRIFDQAALIFVRDDFSMKEAIKLGCEKGRFNVSVDPIFGQANSGADNGCNLSSYLLQRDLEITNLTGPYLGVVVRNWNYDVNQENWEAEVAGAIDKFNDIYGGTIIFIPFQESQEELLNDRELSERIIAKLNSKGTAFVIEEKSFRKKISYLNCCDLVLGMRYHSVLFSINNLIPVVGLVYDPKVDSIFKRLGLQNYSVDIKTVDKLSLFNIL
ncbi:polysaccharide pyruvyl transferase family protein, partial [Chloroflexota bacterium]